MEEFFSGYQVQDHLIFPARLQFNSLDLQLKSVKIIKDRDEKPKGFGYVEFAELEGLKQGLTKSGNVSTLLVDLTLHNTRISFRLWLGEPFA